MPEPYAEERTDPRIPACVKSRISLVFDGSFLRATGTKKPFTFTAVSGRKNDEGKFDYSLERQKIRNQGPIPAGEYWIQPSQMWENNWFKSLIIARRSAWGNFRLTIHPYPGTQTYGRGGFFIHGGSTPGSAGCIDLMLNIDKFVEQLRTELEGLPECYVPLTVRYPSR